MALRERYAETKRRLLADATICIENRELFEKFLAYEEYKLRRVNGLAVLDDNSLKTVLDYVSRLRTVNRWFANKPWERLTKDDIKLVYDQVEDGTICTLDGRPFKARGTYYRRILRSKPFEMAGKKQLVQEVMEFQLPRPREEVRFIREPTFRALQDVVASPEHRALFWLAWDLGENVSSLLRVTKSDCRRMENPHSQEPEYHITLRREILKRSRTPRAEITNYRETVEQLDRLLQGLGEHDCLFGFGHRMATKALARAVRITGARCIPGGQPVTLKDLRSSMACDLLSKGWTTDEVNQRLGHKPSSREIDKYVNWLALGRHRPKRRLHDNHVEALSREIQELKDRETLSQQRLRVMQNQVEQLQAQLESNNQLMYEQVRRLVTETQNAESSRRVSKAG